MRYDEEPVKENTEQEAAILEMCETKMAEIAENVLWERYPLPEDRVH